MIVLIASFSLGYGLNYYRITKSREKDSQKQVQPLTEQVEINNTSENEGTDLTKNEYIITDNDSIAQTSINKENNKVAVGAVFVFQTKYDVCGHEETETITVPDNLVNCSEEEIRLAYPEWNIESFSRNKVHFFKLIDGKCLKHYVLKEYDGKIGVFYQNPKNNNEIKEIIDVNIQHLRQEDRELLQKGIMVESNEELAQIIEDYSS